MVSQISVVGLLGLRCGGARREIDAMGFKCTQCTPRCDVLWGNVAARCHTVLLGFGGGS